MAETRLTLFSELPGDVLTEQLLVLGSIDADCMYRLFAMLYSEGNEHIKAWVKNPDTQFLHFITMIRAELVKTLIDMCYAEGSENYLNIQNSDSPVSIVFFPLIAADVNSIDLERIRAAYSNLLLKEEIKDYFLVTPFLCSFLLDEEADKDPLLDRLKARREVVIYQRSNLYFQANGYFVNLAKASINWKEYRRFSYGCEELLGWDSFPIFNLKNAKLKELNRSSKINFRLSNFAGATIEQSEFEGNDLQGVNFAGVTFINVKFDKVDLRGSSFEGATFNNVTFSGNIDAYGEIPLRLSPINMSKTPLEFLHDRQLPDGTYSSRLKDEYWIDAIRIKANGNVKFRFRLIVMAAHKDMWQDMDEMKRRLSDLYFFARIDWKSFLDQLGEAREEMRLLSSRLLHQMLAPVSYNYLLQLRKIVLEWILEKAEALHHEGNSNEAIKILAESYEHSLFADAKSIIKTVAIQRVNTLATSFLSLFSANREEAAPVMLAETGGQKKLRLLKEKIVLSLNSQPSNRV